MKTKTLRGGAIALAVLVGSAVAVMPALADGGWTARLDRSNYPPIWQGAYIGLHVGHGESGSADGFVGGGQIGYNWQSGLIVYGLEADVSFADISVDANFGNASIDWMATARGRLGYLLLPNLLAYGTVGFGVANGSASFGGFSVNDTESDIVYGLGIEGKFSDKLSARIEYLAFGDLDIDVVQVGLNYRLGN